MRKSTASDRQLDLFASIFGGPETEAAAFPQLPSQPTFVATASTLLINNNPDGLITTLTGDETAVWKPAAATVSAEEMLQALHADEIRISNPLWDSVDMDAHRPPTGDMARIDENMRIITAFKSLGDQPATKAHREMLLRYSGWGAVARIFSHGHKGQLEDRAKTLRDMLGEDGWKSAAATTPTAYFTTNSLVRFAWNMLIRAGFKGGRIIEPTAGTGAFLAGMPLEIGRASQITAVELDTVSGNMLKQAYSPLGVSVHVAGIQDVQLPTGYFDLAIGNVPFGEYQVGDVRKVAFANWSIHNYCVARSIELVRPGGLVLVLTSTHTMDSKAGMVRKWLAANAQLLDAVRLPQGTFSEHAGTEASCDLLLLRKRAVPVHATKDQWASPLADARDVLWKGEVIPTDYRYSGRESHKHELNTSINPWFNRHPNRMLGKLENVRGAYGVTAKCMPSEPLDVLLAQVLESSPTDIYTEASVAASSSPIAQDQIIRPLHVHERAKPGSLVLQGPTIAILQADGTAMVMNRHLSDKARQRITGMIGIRDAARELITAQAQNCADEELRRRQIKLGARYDAFVLAHGYLTEKANANLFMADPDFPLLLALEKWNSLTKKATKAPIFTQRTVSDAKLPDSCESVEDALLVSLAATGRVHIPDIVKRTGKKFLEVTQELVQKKLAFKDPITGRWLIRDEYLSGDVGAKLAEARQSGADFAANVQALEEVQPALLGPGEISVRLGAPWIPIAYIEKFADDLMGTKDAFEVKYEANGSTWSVRACKHLPSALAAKQWGTSHRQVTTIIEDILNLQSPKVYYTDGDGKQCVDRQATLEVGEKIEQVKTEFQDWVTRNSAVQTELVNIYNSIYNRMVVRKFDGSHLTLPGLSEVDKPMPHQKNAIWRGLTGGNTLLAHCVGAGKTLTMIATAMEMARLALRQKVVLVIPNHLIFQVSKEIALRYPNANILMFTKHDLETSRRREKVVRAATWKWDLVVMTQSVFEKLTPEPALVLDFIDEKLAQVEMALLAAEKKAKQSVKQLQKKLLAMSAKFKLAANGKGDKDNIAYWNELGVDQILYDEAHAAKNLMRTSKMPRVAGLSNAASYRAFDLLIKSTLLPDMAAGKESGMILATATPIANSVAEMFVMQTYLQPHTLNKLGIHEFDAWAATFGEVVTGVELSPDGSGYRVSSRFARFVNVADLMNIFRQTADIQTRQMLKLPTPKIAGGAMKVVTCPASPELKEFTKSLVLRAQNMKDPKTDNMLAITHQGRLAALDMRLINPSLAAFPQGKLAKAVVEIRRVLDESAHQKGTIMVFCDMSTPKKAGFSVYNQLRSDLVDAGVPAEWIAFIHDYDTDLKKEALFARVRSGDVRVLLGSTLKMGVGTNAQERLKAIMHLDFPWRPADMEQRNGRGLRMGNMWDEIELISFCTENSFDAYIAQSLEVKAGFIEQVMSGDSSVRVVEDIGATALSFAELKALASGNPLVLEKAGLDADHLRMQTRYDMWRNEQWAYQRRITEITSNITRMEKKKGVIQAETEALNQHIRQSGIRFTPSMGAAAKAYTASAHSDEWMRVAAVIREISRITSGGKDNSGTEAYLGNIGNLQLNLRRSGTGAPFIEVYFKESQEALIIESSALRVSDESKTAQQLCQIHSRMTASFTTYLERIEFEKRQLEKTKSLCQSQFPEMEKLKAIKARIAEIAAALDFDKNDLSATVIEPEQLDDGSDGEDDETVEPPEMELA